MSSSVPKPPYDPLLVPFLTAQAEAGGPAVISPSFIPILRKALNEANTLDAVLKPFSHAFTHQEHSAPGPHGSSVPVSVFTPKRSGKSGSRPAIFYMHSGGLICGNRFTGLGDVLGWAEKSGAVCITVEYRLSPEHPFPTPLDDCFAAYQWVGANLSRMGIDAGRVLLSGQSAGGGLALSVAIMSRDRNAGPRACGVMMDTPMLDDRHTSSSSKQYDSDGTWTRGSSFTAWNAYLGENAVGGTGVSVLAAPGRASVTDLVGLPPMFVTAGSAEIFRDESVDHAKKLWEAGVQAELHVWPGGVHCFDMVQPDLPVSKQSLEAKARWVEKMLSQGSAGSAKLASKL